MAELLGIAAILRKRVFVRNPGAADTPSRN
jgi:hypothetical protein